MMFFQAPDHENENGRGDKKKLGNHMDYLFKDRYAVFTKNDDVFRKIGFETSEIRKSTRLIPPLQKIGKQAQNRR